MRDRPKLQAFAVAVAILSVVAGATFLVLEAIRSQEEALASLERQSLDTREAASRRIDNLNATILSLEERIIEQTRRIEQQNRQIDALREQVRDLGGEPVIVRRSVRSSPSSATDPPSTPDEGGETAVSATSETTTPTTTTTQPRDRGDGEKKGHDR